MSSVFHSIVPKTKLRPRYSIYEGCLERSEIRNLLSHCCKPYCQIIWPGNTSLTAHNGVTIDHTLSHWCSGLQSHKKKPCGLYLQNNNFTSPYKEHRCNWYNFNHFRYYVYYIVFSLFLKILSNLYTRSDHI